jgi:hypothetical protein
MCGELTELEFTMLPKDLDLLRAVEKFVAGQAPPTSLPPLIASVDPHSPAYYTPSTSSSSSSTTSTSTSTTSTSSNATSFSGAIAVAGVAAAVTPVGSSSGMIPIEDSKPQLAPVHIPSEKEENDATDNVQAHSKGLFGTIGASFAAMTGLFADEVDLEKIAGIKSKPK